MEILEFDVNEKPVSHRRRTSVELLREAHVPMARHEQDAVLDVAKAESGIVADTFRMHLLRALERAREVVRAIQGRLDRKIEERAATQAELDAAPRGNVPHAVLFGVCAAAALAGEYVLNAITLGFMLSLDPGSPAGIAIAAAPTTAVALLKVVFARTLEEPWQGAPSRGRARWVSVAMAGVLVVLGFLNLGTLALLGLAREDAMNWIAALTNDGGLLSGVDLTNLNHALVLVTVSIGISGGWFLVLTLQEFRFLTHRWGASRRLARIGREQTALEHEVAEASAELAVCADRWEQREERCRDEAEHFLAEKVCLLLQRAGEAPTARRH